MKVFLPGCLRFWKCSIWKNNAMVLFGSLWVIVSDRFAVPGESPRFCSSVQPKAISRTQNVLQTDFLTNTISLCFSASLSSVSGILTLDIADAVPKFIYHFSFPQIPRCVKFLNIMSMCVLYVCFCIFCMNILISWFKRDNLSSLLLIIIIVDWFKSLTDLVLQCAIYALFKH